jgi:hypothetical protein
MGYSDYRRAAVTSCYEGKQLGCVGVAESVPGREVVSLVAAVMKARFAFGALLSLAALSSALGADRSVVIDLSAQRATLIDHGQIALCAPIASVPGRLANSGRAFPYHCQGRQPSFRQFWSHC